MKPARGSILVAVAALAVVVAATRTPAARSDESREKKVKEAAEQSTKAAKAFDEIMQVPDKAIPRELLSRAKAVAVFPRVIKVAVTVGGEGGRGVVSRQTCSQRDRIDQPLIARHNRFPSCGVARQASGNQLAVCARRNVFARFRRLLLHHYG